MSLTGKTPASTYQDLLQVDNSNSGIDGTLRAIKDGAGNASPLQLSNALVEVSPATGQAKLNVSSNDSASLVAIGNSSVSQAAALDFLSGGNGSITDARLISTGGTASPYEGTLTIRAGQIDIVSGVNPVGMNNGRIRNVADPTGAQDAATKNYVDTTFIPTTGGTITGSLDVDNVNIDGSTIKNSSSGTTLSISTTDDGDINIIPDGDGDIRLGSTSGPTNGNVTVGYYANNVTIGYESSNVNIGFDAGNTNIGISNVGTTTDINLGTGNGDGDITIGANVTNRTVTIRGDSITIGDEMSMNTHKITDVVDPTADQDAATKKYVDDQIASESAVQFLGEVSVSGSSTTVDETDFSVDFSDYRRIEFVLYDIRGSENNQSPSIRFRLGNSTISSSIYLFHIKHVRAGQSEGNEGNTTSSFTSYIPLTRNNAWGGNGVEGSTWTLNFHIRSGNRTAVIMDGFIVEENDQGSHMNGGGSIGSTTEFTGIQLLTERGSTAGTFLSGYIRVYGYK